MDLLKRSAQKDFIKENGGLGVLVGILGTGVFLFLLMSAIKRPVFHDEFSFLSNSLYFTAFKTLKPYFTNYPSLYSYLISIPITLLFWAITAARLPAQSPLDPYAVSLIFDLSLPVWLVTARLLSVLSWGATVLLTARLAARRYGSRAAILAAALVIVDPYKVFLPLSWLVLPDVMIALLALLEYRCCEYYLENIRQKPGALFCASALAGVAAGLKLNGALLVIPVLVTPWISREKSRPLKLTIKLLIAFIAVFLAGSPFLLLAPHSFLQGFRVESQLLFNQNNTTGIAGNILATISTLWQKDALLTLLLFPIIIFSAYQGPRDNGFFLSLITAALIIIGSLDKQSLSYYLFLFPLGAIQAAGLFHAVEQKLPSKSARNLLYAGTALFFIALTFKTAVFIREESRPDTRRTAEEWIRGNIPAGSSLLLDWAYVPQVEIKRLSKFIKVPALHTPEPGRDSLYRTVIKTFRGDMQYYRTDSLVNSFYQPARLIQSDARYLITSSLCYQRYLESAAVSSWDDAAMDRLEANRFNFYRLLMADKLPYRILRRFNTGTGPEVLIFERTP